MKDFGRAYLLWCKLLVAGVCAAQVVLHPIPVLQLLDLINSDQPVLWCEGLLQVLQLNVLVANLCISCAVKARGCPEVQLLTENDSHNSFLKVDYSNKPDIFVKKCEDLQSEDTSLKLNKLGSWHGPKSQNTKYTECGDQHWSLKRLINHEQQEWKVDDVQQTVPLSFVRIFFSQRQKQFLHMISHF